jgi:hypothetical protein
MNLGSEYLATAIRRMKYYRGLGEQALAQVSADQFYWQPDPTSNSIGVIIQHMSGNMQSRWTDFLTTDGEKRWRNRDAEFETLHFEQRALLELWAKGWDTFLGALVSLTEADLLKTVYIRNEGLLVIDAINRQLAHYPYHVGQIVYLARLICKENWRSLSIPVGQSEEFNKQTGIKDPARHL